MANYFQLFQRGFKNRYLRKIYIPENKLDCIINHPGGCGGVTLSKHINQFQYTNYHIEKEYGYQKAIAHLIKPPSVFYKKKIKVIILKRDLNEIYNSLKKRGFLRNSLVWYGDLLPFRFFNNDEKKLKEKFIGYLEKFYENWEKYPDSLKIVINYPNIFQSTDDQNSLKLFLNIKDQKFIENFPKFDPYAYEKDFIDPSS